MTTADTIERLKAELAWLKDNPDFEERPATLLEFLGPDYLNIDAKVRPAIKTELSNIFGDEVTSEHIAAYPLAMITGGIGIGKGQVETDLVATPKGWRAIGDLMVGDEVIGSDGKPTTVTGVFHRGLLPVYRVSFTDHTSLVVDGDHLWSVQTPKDRHRGKGWQTKATRDLLAEGVLNGRGQRKWHIPVMSGPAALTGSDLPVKPYSLGAIIGDGGCTQGQVILSTTDPEILDRVVAETGVDARHRAGCDYRLVTDRGKPNPLLDAIRNLGLTCLAQHKFIPSQYLEAAAEDRLELLRGLMDTDGWLNDRIGHSAFNTTSERLAADVAELVRSLGGTARITFKRNDFLGSFNVTVNLPVNPFWLRRKADRWRPHSKYPATRMIAAIEPAGVERVVCIQVAAQDSLYVARDYIVTHNTTVASIVLTYLAHWVLCLKDPQDFFGLLPGSRIAFMQMSTSEKQALEVVFGDIKARVQHSPWFQAKYPYDPNYKNQLRFEKDIWIIPGDSAETTFEGYNILGGILDEADSHKITQTKDYAEQGYTTIHSRIDSRFGRVDRGGVERGYGFLLVIGQMKSASGFAARKYAEFRNRDDAYAVSMAIWESLGWERFLTEDGERDSFFYDTVRKQIIPKKVSAFVESETMIEVPNAYLRDFQNNPEKALRDLAGHPPAVGDPFISLTHKIFAARDRWSEHHPGLTSPVDSDGRFANWFFAPDSLKRVAHIDLAYSAEGDALGIAMGHVREVVEIDGERKPYIVIDMLMRLHAPPGGEIFLGDVRRLIYSLRDERKFRLQRVTIDGFQSQDTIQQLARRRFETDAVSVDKQVLPYHDLREAIYEDRIEFPPYLVRLRRNDTEMTEVLVKELTELIDNGAKIDHPPSGSKDVADAVAGVVYTLMGDRAFQRNVVRMDAFRAERQAVAAGGLRHHAYLGDRGIGAPLPPNSTGRY